MFNRYKLYFVFSCVVMCGLVDLGRMVSANGEGWRLFFLTIISVSFLAYFFSLPTVAVKWTTLRLGSPIPKTLVIQAAPSHITLAIWVRVRVTGDAHITKGRLGMGMHKTRACPNHCDTAPSIFVQGKSLATRLFLEHPIINSPLKNGEENWTELCFAETSGTVRKVFKKLLANS